MKNINFERKKRLTPFLITMTVLLFVYSISLLIPIIWSIISSFRVDWEFSAQPWKFSTFTFDNYIYLFSEFSMEYSSSKGVYVASFFTMLYNSLFYCVGGAVVANLSRCICAYVCARFPQFKFTKVMYSIVIICMTISFPSNLATTIKYYKMMGIYENMYMSVALSMSFQGANFLFFYAAFVGLSKEYSEAAQIDGANQFVTMTKVMMPMIMNIFMAVTVLEFVAKWNDYAPNVVHLRNYPMLSYALFNFINQPTAVSEVSQFGACVMVMIPTLIIFVVFKDHIMSNLSIGGVKG